MQVRMYDRQVKMVAPPEEHDIGWVLEAIRGAERMGLLKSVSVILTDGSSLDILN